MQVQGTTNSGTEVQILAERSDQELHDALIAAFQAAESDAKRFIFSTGTLAAAIMDVHQTEVWKRTIDESTGALYSSAKAYYTAISSRFPLLHKLLRDDLVAELYGGEFENMIGVRELAALVHCDPAQITRSAKKVKAELEAKAKAEAEAAATEAAVAAAAEAAAEAAAAGASEAEAEAAAAAVLKFAEAEAKKAAAAEEKAAAEAEAKAEEAATKKAVKGALSTLETGIQKASDQRHLMTAEQRAQALKMARDAVSSWVAFDKLLKQAEAEATAPAPAPEAPKPGGRRKVANG